MPNKDLVGSNITVTGAGSGASIVSDSKFGYALYLDNQKNNQINYIRTAISTPESYTRTFWYCPSTIDNNNTIS
jgi:hypothetical protein